VVELSSKNSLVLTRTSPSTKPGQSATALILDSAGLNASSAQCMEDFLNTAEVICGWSAVGLCASKTEL